MILGVFAPLFFFLFLPPVERLSHLFAIIAAGSVLGGLGSSGRSCCCCGSASAARFQVFRLRARHVMKYPVPNNVGAGTSPET